MNLKLKDVLNNPEIIQKLEQLIYCCDGRRCELSDRNYGSADKWIRHIDKAYEDFQEVFDELEGNEYEIYTTRK